SEAERHRILVEWNQTEREYPRETTVHGLFEEQVERTPEAGAVVFEGEQLSYRELNRRANRLAHHLRGLGVGPEVPVGICMERSLEMVVGLLGILKAGGAYVPLDPAYPRQRLALLIRDTGMPVLLTEEGLAGRLPAEGCVQVRVDAEAAAIGRESGDNLPPAGSGGALACVMYTSGSTGTPKGVAVPHRGVVRLVTEVDYVRIGPDEVFLQLAPLSFDASTFELWGALLSGARCVLFPGRVPTPADLRSVIATHRVSMLWLTASLFNAVVDADPGVLSGIHQLLVGGEALSVAHVRRALEALPSTRIINGYGPTEGTTFTCCYSIPERLDEVVHSIPIGAPISNTRVYILDRKRNPVPIGVAGELHVGGDGLARGYLNSPELTAEKFIPDPFTDEAGGQLYRTGDLARYRPDGQIEFLGRLDKQMKIRGFRIEPGEVEAVLGEHPAVASAAVLAREDLPGDRRLVAYVVRRDGKRDAIPDLRDCLAAKLPEYMVPSAFVVLGSLPLIASGKVDWRALPQPGPERAEPGRGGSLPQDTLQLALLKIWEEVLGVRPIGVKDNFFELGGHSLLAVRLFVEIEKAFSRRLP
ncbi:MAG: non-ribosomal peptide synthetase, partial [Candidatus Methylomirabilis sp.]